MYFLATNVFREEIAWPNQWTKILKNVVRIAGPLQSTRWSPTAEQLMALEELYRNGTRTPTAQQIQEITSKLRRFGKIEGKNVFYWFQNHKARDKKKQRLKMEAAARSNLHVVHNNHYSKTFDQTNQSGKFLIITNILFSFFFSYN